MNKRLIVIAVVGALTGCASSPDQIESAYVSPVKYENYSCDQIAREMGGVSERTVSLHQRLDKKATDDKVQMGVGLVLFWPALFFLEGGDGPEATEYANLKGEYSALRQSANQKHCNMAAMPPSPESIIQAEAEKRKTHAEQKPIVN